jgi:hypothetical protein
MLICMHGFSLSPWRMSCALGSQLCFVGGLKEVNWFCLLRDIISQKLFLLMVLVLHSDTYSTMIMRICLEKKTLLLTSAICLFLSEFV